MKNFSAYGFREFIPYSCVLIAAFLAVILTAGFPGPSLAANGFHLFTLAASILICNLFPESKGAVARRVFIPVFFMVNLFYILLSGIVYHLFRSDVTLSLVLYFLENTAILFTDTLAVLSLVPAGLYGVILIALAAGFLVFYCQAGRALQKIPVSQKFPVIYISVFAAIYVLIKISGLMADLQGDAGSFRGIDLKGDARTRQSFSPGFMERYGYRIRPGADIVFIILEGVSAEYFDTSTSRYLNNPGMAVRAENFFVPTPHTTTSIYSLLTGNYPDYRSRQNTSSADALNSLPAMLRGRGYGTYFLYSGPTFFEGLHGMLAGFGFTIINKEKLEALTDPRTGRRYRSFNWGVDDSSLVKVSGDMLSECRQPGLFFIGLSSTHSPYFNPDPERFRRFDNSTAEGRYRNSIDYEVLVIDSLIETFMRHNSDTLFVILGDHGESFGQEGYSKHSFSLYNTEIRVPFIMLHRSFEKGGIRFSGSIIDVYPSLADLMGLEINSPVDGRSFFSGGYRLSLFLSSWRDGESKGLILGNKKWIYSRNSGKLFEMNIDDSGRIDLSSDPGKGSIVKFLNRQY